MKLQIQTKELNPINNLYDNSQFILFIQMLYYLFQFRCSLLFLWVKSRFAILYHSFQACHIWPGTSWSQMVIMRTERNEILSSDLAVVACSFETNEREQIDLVKIR